VLERYFRSTRLLISWQDDRHYANPLTASAAAL
jgi:hypothetical protein